MLGTSHLPVPTPRDGAVIVAVVGANDVTVVALLVVLLLHETVAASDLAVSRARAE